MKFKILTARNPKQAQEEISRFKIFCDASRIKDIRIAGGSTGFVITIVYEQENKLSKVIIDLNEFVHLK